MNRLKFGIHAIATGFICLGVASGQTLPAVVLEIQVDNEVIYTRDTWDPSVYALERTVTQATPGRNFNRAMGAGDIVSVNGKPAKGLWFTRVHGFLVTPNPQPGQGIGDVNRAGFLDWSFEILQPDGTPIGTIMATGQNLGPAPPGAPRSVAAVNMTVVGGTGAYLGARGQAGIIRTQPGPLPINASMREDPALRREFARSKRTMAIHLIPMERPTVVSAMHADFSPVTMGHPARPGEVIIIRAIGLGPTRPGVDPGQPFPTMPAQEVNSPLEVKVNDISSEPLNKVGWPGTSDYRVDFRVPAGTPQGNAEIQLTVASIPGPEFRIPVR